jgi:hypothetical protein
MDIEFQQRLLEADFVRLQKEIETGGRNIRVELDAPRIFARFYGRGGESEPYLAKIEAAFYPVTPWRVGFIDPSVEGETRLLVPDRDPRFWPYSGLPGLNGGFHVSYPGPYRVFVCHPFTTEYFHYHADKAWEPEVYNLVRVIVQLDEEVKKADHFSKWYPLVSRGGL